MSSEFPGRLSSSWAVNAALRLRGLEDIPESTIFGLGASAWYRLERSSAGHPVLLALHPERIKQSLYALNVYAVRFNYLSADAQAQVRERTRQGVSTLIAVDRFALPADFGQDAGVARPPHGLDYTLLVHRDKDGTDDDVFWVQGPRDPAPRQISAADLQRAWFRPAADGAVATFYWHPVIHLNWQPEFAIAQALQRHSVQMRHTYPSLGPTGLGALGELLAQLDAGDTRALEAAARCGQADGGLSLCRDLMAEFARMAARRLDLPQLDLVARHFDACAGLWSQLLHEFLEGRPNSRTAHAAVSSILQHERAAIDGIEHALAKLAVAEEGACQS